MSTTPLTPGFPNPDQVPPPPSRDDLYKKIPGGNPAVRGASLSFVSWLVRYIPPFASVAWNNTGFGKLREFKVAHSYPIRFEPTVIPRSAPLEVEAAVEATHPIHPLFSKLDPAFYSSGDFVEAYKSKRTTPTLIARHLLSFIRSAPHNIAFIEINDESTLAAAKASTERYANGRQLGPLDGVPIAVKDEFDVAGYRRTYGSAAVFSKSDCQTSWAVKKLVEAGAIVIGKTNMSELLADTTGNNPAKGTPRNPYNSDYYTGGSSSGSAYAVAAGIVPIAVASDAAGSIRIPSTQCGVYGLKTSHGRVSALPGPSLSGSNSVVGPIAATLDDLAIAYRIMSAPDPDSPSSRAFPPPLTISAPIVSPDQPAQKVLGIFRPWFEDCDPVIKARCNLTLDKLVDRFGYQVVEIEIPYLYESQVALCLSILSETQEGVVAEKGTKVDKFNAAIKMLMTVASKNTAKDYIAASRIRSMMMSHIAHLFTMYPGMVIVTPGVSMLGVKIGKTKGELKTGLSDIDCTLRTMHYTFLANFTGCPSVVSGIGYDDPRPDDKSDKGKQTPTGLPITLMGTAEWGMEETLLGFARDVGAVTILPGRAGTGEERRRGKIWVNILGEVGAGRDFDCKAE